MASFKKSLCFTQGVNIVANRNIDYHNKFSYIELHNKMMEGYIIDYKSLANIENTKPNMGSKYFKLAKE